MTFNRIVARWLIFVPTFIAAFILICYATALMSWPPKAITNAKLTLLNETAEPGDRVWYNVEICKHVDAASEIHYGLKGIDPPGYFYAGTEWGTAPEGCFSQHQSVIIPEEVPPGRYIIQVQAILRINALRTDMYDLHVGEIHIQEKANGEEK